MNPIESYRDASLDALVTSRAPPPLSKRSGHSRQTSIAANDPYAPPSALPFAPEAPQGPLIAYPGTDQTGREGVQRSFSQRARNRPYFREAIADDDLADERRHEFAQRQQYPQHASARDRRPPQQDTRESDIRRQQTIQDKIRQAASAAAPPVDEDIEDSAPYNATHEDFENTAPGLVRGSTMKDPTNTGEQRDWAPDRSPLQKLEVTLNDISKEEKRARVQEAEMLHREKKKRAQETSQRANANATRQPAFPSSNPSQPSTIEDAGVVRSLSNTHKDRLHHSTVVESRRPDASRLSNDGQGFEYESAAAPPRSVTITRRGQTTSGQPRSDVQRGTSSSQTHAYQDSSPNITQNRSVSATQPKTYKESIDSTLPRASQRTKQTQIYDSDRTPTSQERNASHRAALQQLEGPRGLSNTRTESRRTRNEIDDRFQDQQQPSFADKEITTSRSSDASWTRPAQTNQLNIRTSTPQGQSIPIGLEAQDSPGLQSNDSPRPVERPNPVQRHKRQSSVSFKEPYDRRRPIDEWKAAETARLLPDDFLSDSSQSTTPNKAWWESDPNSGQRSGRPQAARTTGNLAIDDRAAEFKPRLLLKCGPLLRYTGMRKTIGAGAKEYWRGTVMMVTQDSQSSYETPPVLRVFAQPKSLYTHPPTTGEDGHHAGHFDPLAGTIKMSRIGRALYVRPVQNLPSARDLSQIETDDGLFESSPPITNTNTQSVSVAPIASRLSEKNGESFGRHKEIKGVRLYADPDRDVTFWLFKLEIQLGPEQQHIGYRINNGAASGFWVPAEGQTMHIMFHSCNGFSMSVNPEEFSGPDPLWRDVLNAHQSRPFHVMIGGGDQIYNDKVMAYTRHFAEWTANKNPHYKHNSPLTTEMKEELETFYLENYSTWFSQGLFSMANAQIPMVNMWDDHDIIDGFGSYPHPFMLSPVFSGLGNIAFKYYMLFQQHSVEAMTSADEPSWLLGYKPGPYIKQQSRSIFLHFGRHVAFLALDCRTERMKNQVLSVDTCDMALERCRREIVEGQTKHLVLLLGVPIAYPRMNWLENVLTSRAMDPVKALGRYGVLKGGFLNRFDGGVEVLDDLDDHWTAHHHKEERNEIIKELQDLAAERSVRITILGGDVHLGAIGQFYSNPKLKIPKDRDHRYMPNVISSAIVNTPPPEMLADVLNKRNKVHHLDSYTDESMIPMFTHDTNLKKRNNKHLLPRRNWCSITEYVPGRTPTSSRSSSPSRMESFPQGEELARPEPKRRFSLTRQDTNPRNLFRRLSSRNAPPTAYREDDADDDRRAGSFDDARPDRSQSRTWNEKLGFGRRTASETRQPTTNGNGMSNDNVESRQPPPFRPGFHRRPTNMSEKAAMKGNVPAIDAEGNEIDVNGSVNLDGGLDVVLHCEVDRNDPSGMTEPYRLLIPALWYDGSSDREKLDVAGGLQRKPTLMNRMGFGGRGGQKAARNQGAGNWGQETSDNESYSGSETETEQQPKKKKVGLIGSLKKTRPEYNAEGDRDASDHYGAGARVNPPDNNAPTQPPLAPSSSVYRQVTAPDNTKPSNSPLRVGFQAGLGEYDMAGSMPSVPREGAGGTSNRSSAQTSDFTYPKPQRASSFKAANLLRKNSLKRSNTAERSTEVVPSSPAAPTNRYAPEPVVQNQPRFQPQPQPQSNPQQQYQYPQPIRPTPPSTTRKNSYTIGSARSSGSQSQPQPQYSSSRTQQSYGADSTYSSSQPQRNTNSRAVSNPLSSNATTGPPSSYPTQTADSMQRSSSTRSSNTGTSTGSYFDKQAPVLGIATDHDAFSGNPQQRSLRGNGIIGRIRRASFKRSTSNPGPASASADQINTGTGLNKYQANLPHGQSQDRGDFGAPQRSYSQEYSGIEAYKEKPKRGLSLTDRARNLFDRDQKKEKYDDEDDDDYSYSSGESYSDEDDEQDRDTHHARNHHHEQPHNQSQNQQQAYGQGYDTRPQLQTQTQNSSYRRGQRNDSFSDDASFVDAEDGLEGSSRPSAPKRSLSQKIRLGMKRMGSKKGGVGATGDEREQEKNYY